MARNGSGVYSPPGANYPAVSNTLITAANRNAVDADIATALTQSIAVDGQSVVTGNIPLAGFKLTGVGAATARTDAATIATIQDGTGVYVGTVGGTADAITLTPSPAITAYAAGQTFRWIASGANTTAVTLQVSGLASPKAVTKNGTTALVAGDITSGAMVEATYDGTRFVLGAVYTAAIPVSIVDAAGDLIVGTAADTAARKAVGTAGTVLMSRAAETDKLAYVAALNKAIYGLTYDNGTDATNDININTGGAMDATGAYWMTLASALGKQSDVAWAVGGTTGAPAGMLDTGAVGNSDYYLWLIARSDTGVVDALCSLSSTAPTMPANYDFKRLIGWFKRVGGTIVAFKTYETEGGGLELLWSSPTLDINLANTLTTSRRTDAVKVPLNFSTVAIMNLMLADATSGYAWIYCPDQTDLAPSATVTPLSNGYADPAVPGEQPLFVRTSAAGLIAARSTVATMDSYFVSTMGFTWARRN